MGFYAPSGRQLTLVTVPEVCRRGSTTGTLFWIAEVLALSSIGRTILAIDDLGDGLDPAASAHLATLMRRSGGQAWVTTRVAGAAEVFEPEEVVRLGKDAGGTRHAKQGIQPSTKAETVAAKHWHRSLLPALSYRSVVVVEGPNDFAALHSLALRLSNESDIPLPAARSVSIINSGSGGSGGYAAVLKLAASARAMGLRAIGAVDGDTREEAKQHLQTYGGLPDAVLRLPDGVAIEAALVIDLPDKVLIEAISDIADVAGIAKPANIEALAGDQLTRAAISFIKSNSLHGPFIDALSSTDLPPIAVQFLNRAVEVATGTESGLIQL